MPMVLKVIIAIVVLLAVAVATALVTKTIAIRQYKEIEEAKIGNADEKARSIIDEALRDAETKKREALLEAKEEAIRTKNEIEHESKERRAEIQRYEKRVLSKEETLSLLNWKSRCKKLKLSKTVICKSLKKSLDLLLNKQRNIF